MAAAPALQCVRIADKVGPAHGQGGKVVFQVRQCAALRGQIPAMLFNGVLQALQRRCISLLRHIAVSRVQAVLQAGQRPTLRGQIPAMLFNGVLQALQRRCISLLRHIAVSRVQAVLQAGQAVSLRFQAAFGSCHAGRQIRQRAGISLAADILTQLRHIRLQFRDRAALRRNILPVLRD